MAAVAEAATRALHASRTADARGGVVRAAGSRESNGAASGHATLERGAAVAATRQRHNGSVRSFRHARPADWRLGSGARGLIWRTLNESWDI